MTEREYVENTGTFIVLEGSDGSGKETQFRLLAERLKRDGHDVAAYDFPRYSEPSSYFLRCYLNGLYGSVNDVNPYTASLFYALDRFEAAHSIREALAAGKIVLANRFTGSNMAHQGAKFTNAEERRGFFLWLDSLEFGILNIPRPDVSLVLRVPAELATALIDKRSAQNPTSKKLDIHEADLDHLRSAVAVYDDLCSLFPKDFRSIDCTRNGKLLRTDEVHQLVRQTLAPLLPKRIRPQTVTNAKASTADLVSVSMLAIPALIQAGRLAQRSDNSMVPEDTLGYHIPAAFDADTKKSYVQVIEQILAIYRNIAHTVKESGRPETIRETWDVLPVAVQRNLPIEGSPKTEDEITPATKSASKSLRKVADAYLHPTHTEALTDVVLVSAAPRNEMDTVPEILYCYSNQTLEDLTREARSWPIKRKEEVMAAYLRENSSALDALKNVHYVWELNTSFATFSELISAVPGLGFEWQALTPRYGYDVPLSIEELGLADMFEQCFDLSLELYSKLQAAGYTNEAQYATLLGHRLRWKMNCSLDQLRTLLKGSRMRSSTQRLASKMLEQISEVHPMIAAYMK